MYFVLCVYCVVKFMLALIKLSNKATNWISLVHLNYPFCAAPSYILVHRSWFYRLGVLATRKTEAHADVRSPFSIFFSEFLVLVFFSFLFFFYVNLIFSTVAYSCRKDSWSTSIISRCNCNIEDASECVGIDNESMNGRLEEEISNNHGINDFVANFSLASFLLKWRKHNLHCWSRFSCFKLAWIASLMYGSWFLHHGQLFATI